MASIIKEIVVDVSAEAVWAAVRDIGGEARLAPSFVSASRVDGEVREITFADGRTAKERILGLDDGARRLAYSIIESQMTHHSASMQVLDGGPGRCRVLWIADLLPHDYAPLLDQRMGAGLAGLKAAQEARAAA